MISEILALFFNTLTLYQKYSFRNSQKLPEPIQMHLSTSNFERFENKMTLIVYVSSILWTAKDMLDKCLKRPFSKHHSTANKLNAKKSARRWFQIYEKYDKSVALQISAVFGTP